MWTLREVQLNTLHEPSDKQGVYSVTTTPEDVDNIEKVECDFPEAREEAGSTTARIPGRILNTSVRCG